MFAFTKGTRSFKDHRPLLVVPLLPFKKTHTFPQHTIHFKRVSLVVCCAKQCCAVYTKHPPFPLIPVNKK